MSEQDIFLRLTTRVGNRMVSVPSITDGNRFSTVEARIGVVRGIVLPDGQVYRNARHSKHLRMNWFMSSQGETQVTVPTDTASRLIKAFRSLRPGHMTECHDFMAAVCGWPLDREFFDYSGDYLERDEDIRAGAPYAVVSQSSDKVVWGHSAIGTDDGQLLSILGKGSSLTVLSPETTRALYWGDEGSYLSELRPPKTI